MNEIKDSEGNIVAKFNEKEGLFSILDFNKINSMEFINPDDQITVNVISVKRYKDCMTGQPKASKKEYITNYVNLETLPEELQNKISKFTMKEYGTKK